VSDDESIVGVVAVEKGLRPFDSTFPTIVDPLLELNG